MSVQLAIFVLALVSLSTGSDLTCNNAVIPLKDMGTTTGKWVLHAASWDHEDRAKDLEILISSWIDLSPISSDGARTIYYADRLTNGTCYQGSASSSVRGSALISTFDVFGQISDHESQFYESCHDCMLVQDTTLRPDGMAQGRFLFLYTRTGNLDASQMEAFRRQAQCLNFLPQFHFTTTDICPDNRETAA